MKKPNTSLLSAASRYAEIGWLVFPCNGKVPLTPNGFKDATTDPAQIEAWWTKYPGANIGVATGKKSGIFVLDIDVKSGAGGYEALSELESEFGELPHTVEAITWSGGRHILFRYPEKGVGCKTGVRPGIDLRGDGGYVIAPPSVIEGKSYEWEIEHHPDETMIADAPEWLLKLLDYAPGNGVMSLDVQIIPSGQRNSKLTSSGGKMRRAGFTKAEIFAALEQMNRDRCKPPLPTREVERIATSLSRYEPDDIAVAFVEDHRRRYHDPSAHEVTHQLKTVSLSNISSTELQPPTYAINPLIPEREATLMGGHGGAGKSILALTQGAHYAAGVSWSGFEVKGGRVAYISLEDPGPLIIYRLKKVCEVYDLPLNDVIENLTILDGSEADGALCVETNEYGVRFIVMTPLFEEVKAVLKGCGLIIIDNASDAYGADENNRRQVRRFIRELRSLARENNAGLLLLAHIDKIAARYGSNGNTYSGSTAWHNSVRSRLALTEKDGLVEFVQEKLNVGKRLDRAISLKWHDGVLIPTGGIFEATEAERQEDIDMAAVLAAIQKAIDDGESVPTARTGPRTTQNVLEKYPDLPGHLRGRNGRELFYSALTALHREGQLTIEEYTTAARNVRQRFRVGSTAHIYTPYTPCAELTKPTQGGSSVAQVSSDTGTDETNETNAGEILEVLE